MISINTKPILIAKNLTKEFGEIKNNSLRPGFRDFSLELMPGETIGIVGESGCGKTTVARSLVRLNKFDSGQLIINNKDFGLMRGKYLRLFRRHIQMVFQDPETSLNPRMTIGNFVSEVFRNFRTVAKDQEMDRLFELLELVGLQNTYLSRYPNQLSGGEKQRVGIMRAIACDPSVLVLDEPTSALDVSVQAQVLTTLKNIQEVTKMCSIFISHDVAVIRYMCDRVIVMYLGDVVEEGPVDTIFTEPKHPYTRSLLNAVPRFRSDKQSFATFKGEATTKNVLTTECSSRLRCPYRDDVCHTKPSLTLIGENHKVACWRWRELKD